ncbi:hypothetical protein [Pseudomonas sp. R5(2019)]|uniref:hypothetical protein n=1 Tax=Pseudomonas sp. R5(2019) TaxID=2697566 RepID=UPI0014125B69|nr:hypothetical protein [Pseudomonas sp. R5(2019)]
MKFLEYRGYSGVVVLLQIDSYFMLSRCWHSSKTTQTRLLASCRVVGIIGKVGKKPVLVRIVAMLSARESDFSAIYNFCTTVLVTALSPAFFFTVRSTPIKDRP